MKFFETSARDGTNVNETFNEIAKAIKDKLVKQQLEQAQKTTSGGPGSNTSSGGIDI